MMKLFVPFAALFLTAFLGACASDGLVTASGSQSPSGSVSPSGSQALPALASLQKPSAPKAARITKPQPPKTQSQLQMRPASSPNDLVMAMNQTRAEFDLSRLRTDPKLNRAARAYAKELASRQLLDHTDLDGNGPGKRVDDVGYRWMFVAENLAAGQDDVKQVVKDWMESPPHRKALLNDKPVHVGIGFVKTSSDALVDPYGSYWVALFAKPR